MRLLSPQEQKDTEREEEERQKKKLADLSESVTRGVKALNEFRQADKEDRERIVKEHSAFMSVLEKVREALLSEVAILEDRRREALKPLTRRKTELDLREKKLDEKKSELSKREEDLAIKKSEVRELADKYKERLGELTDFEGEIKEREHKLDEEKRLFEISMRYKDSVIQNERARLRKYFEEERSKIKKLKQ